METTPIAHARIPENEEIASTLRRLNSWVKIPTHIKNSKNIRLLQETIARDLEALGFSIKFVDQADYSVMIASTPKALASSTCITLVGHVDTALEGGEEIKVQGEHAYAIGVGDDKGGVMVGLRALEKLGTTKLQELPVQFVLSPNEESGSPGFHQLFNELSTKSDWVLGLEPALASGDIIDARCGNRWYQMNFTGIGAHAGRFNEPHANPIHPLASLVARLAPLNDDSAKRRINATDIKVAPGVINAIPEKAELKLDARFSNSFDQKLIDNTIREFLHNKSNVSVELNILDDCPPLERKGPSWFYQNALANIEKHEKKPVCCKFTGGASDANHFLNAKQGVLDGLGPIAKGMHTPHESILISSLETRSNALRDLIHTLGETHA